jgi:hypothetical protein
MMSVKTVFGLLVLIVGTFACRPVLAISWNELVILGVLVSVLLGPSLLKLMRRVRGFLEHEKRDR